MDTTPHPRTEIRWLWLLCATILAMAASTGGEAKERIAVLTLESDGGLTEDQLVYLTDKIRMEARHALAADQWMVMTRESILVLLEQNASDLAACVGQCEVETGRLLGAQYVTVGNIARFGDEFRLMMRCYDTQSAELVAVEEVVASNDSELAEKLGAAASRLFSTGLGGGGTTDEVRTAEVRTVPIPDDYARVQHEPITGSGWTDLDERRIVEGHLAGSAASAIVAASLFAVGLGATVNGAVEANSASCGDAETSLPHLIPGLVLFGSSAALLGVANGGARQAWQRVHPGQPMLPAAFAVGEVLMGIGISLGGVTVGIFVNECEATAGYVTAALGTILIISGEIIALIDAGVVAEKTRDRMTARTAENGRRSPVSLGVWMLPTPEGGMAGLAGRF